MSGGRQYFQTGIIIILILWQHVACLLTLSIKEEKPPPPPITETKLVEELLHKYNPHIRPVKDPHKPVKVWVHPAIYSLINVNTQQETLRFIFWFRMYWKDEFLQWNPAAKGGISKLTLPAFLIWKPDFVIFNAVHTEYGSMPFHRSMVKIEHDGGVHAVMLSIVSARCRFKIMNFPFESQECTMEISSWAYDKDLLEIAPLSETQPESHSVYNENPEWEIEEIRTNLTESEYVWNMEGLNLTSRHFQEVKFTIQFKPKPFYYIFVMVLPSFIVTTVTLLGLFSPFNSNGEREEKVTLGLTNLLTMTVMLQIVENAVPKSADGLAILGQYVFFELAISSVGTVVAVVIMYLHQRALTHGWQPPHWLKFITRAKTPSAKAHYDLILQKNSVSSPFDGKTPKFASKDFEKIKSSVMSCLGVLRSIEYKLDHYEEEKEKTETWALIFDTFDLWLMLIFIVVNCCVTLYVFFVQSNVLR